MSSVRKAGAIVFSEDLTKVLLVRDKRSNKWGPPKGSLIPNETPIQGGLRELREETGICLGERDGLFHHIDVQKVRLFIIQHTTEHVLQTDPFEILDIKWFDVTQFPHDESCNKILKIVKKRLNHCIGKFQKVDRKPRSASTNWRSGINAVA